MIKRISIACFLCGMLALPLAVGAGPLAVGKDDTVSSVLAAQKGRRVTVKLKAGDELTGTVLEANDRLVHLGELAGKEFYDAVVPTDKIGAVIIRTRDQ